jgi:superfamily II DNA or RNA helicase
MGKRKVCCKWINEFIHKNDVRVGEIISNLDKYTNDINDVSNWFVCNSWTCNIYDRKIQFTGLKAECLTSKIQDRDRIRAQFKKKEFNYLFVVDIFNEGVIFEIDTVLF